MCEFKKLCLQAREFHECSSRYIIMNNDVLKNYWSGKEFELKYFIIEFIESGEVPRQLSF